MNQLDQSQQFRRLIESIKGIESSLESIEKELKKFNDSEEWHMKNQDPYFSCDECGESFRLQSNYEDHLDSEH